MPIDNKLSGMVVVWEKNGTVSEKTYIHWHNVPCSMESTFTILYFKMYSKVFICFW